MEVILDVELNEDKDTNYGWYIYGYINRGKGVVSKYSTDTSLISILNIDIKKYRDILKENGSVTLANGRTCFPQKEMAKKAILAIEELINKN